MAGIELATAYVSLVPSLQGAQGTILSELEGAGDEGGSVFGGAFAGTFLGTIASGLFEQAGRAIGTLLGTGFSEAAEAEVANSQLSAAITSTGNAANVSVGELNDLASSIQGYSGQTDDSIAATQALLLRFQNIKNVGVDDIFNQATVAAADMAARLGGDASSQAQKLGRALEDPIAGLTSLNRSGVFFTEQQKAQVEAMIAAGDQLGAQKVIIDQVNQTYGGSAAAFGGTWTGTVERVKRAFEDFTQGALQGLLPIFTPIANGMVSLLQNLAPVAERFGDALSNGVGKALDVVGPLFGQIAQTVGPLIGQFIELWASISPLSIIFQAIQPLLPTLLSAFGQLASVVGGALGQAFQQLLPAFQQIGTAIASLLTSGLTAIIPVIVQLAAVLGPVLAQVISAIVPLISQLAPVFVKIVSAVLPLVAALLPLLPPIASLVGALLPPLISLLVAVLDPILKLISPILDLLVPALQLMVTVAVAVVKGIVDVVTWFVNLVAGSEETQAQVMAAWQAILSFFGSVWSNIVSFFKNGIDQAIGFVQSLPGRILSVLSGLGSLLYNAGRDLIQGFINGITNMIGSVGDAIGGVMDFVAGFFPHSPAERGPFSGRGWTQLRESGLAIADQFNLGLNDAQMLVQPAFTYRVPAISDLGDGVTGVGAGSGSFVNNGTIVTQDVDEFFEVAEAKKRRANALAGIGSGVIG